jgi:hypothetical protein
MMREVLEAKGYLAKDPRLTARERDELVRLIREAD